MILQQFQQPFQGLLSSFLWSAMRVGKLVNFFFKFINILAGSESFTSLTENLPSPLCSYSTVKVDGTNWPRAQMWIDRRTHPQIPKKLCKAYNALNFEDWDELPGTNSPIESINRQSTHDNVKSVSIRSLIEHIYLEDCHKLLYK